MTTANTNPKPTRKATDAPAPAAVDKSRTAQLSVKQGEAEDRTRAGLVARGMVSNAATVLRFHEADFPGLALMEMVRELQAQGEAVNRGDFAVPERLLSAQALTLNAIFGELARRAALNMGEHLDATDRYLRLALKAQSQCRATVETLAAIKNPPVVFARQANINNGGQQRVNNGAVPSPRDQATHTEQTVSKPNELLEDATHGRTQLDTRATPAAGRAHQDLAAVGAVNRSTHR